ncbi:MAG TPA: MFS transporter [Dermatophilaceae bacterium]|nr:MFS transporter [Dermatophilaceae bacterium]
MAKATTEYVNVLRQPGVLTAFAASTLSAWGDNFTRIAIAAVVFNQTGSALATAATFAVAVLPAIFGRSLLAGIADRVRYKHVLVWVNLFRAGVLVAIALCVMAKVPIWVLLSLVVVSVLSEGPELSAHQMLWLDLLPDRLMYARYMGLGNVTKQLNQVVGLGIGGVLLLVMTPSQAVLFDAGTFVMAALAYGRVARLSPLLVEAGTGLAGFFADLASAARYLRGDRILRNLLGLSLCAVWGMTAPEAVAVAYAGAHDNPGVGGLLMAAPILGAATGLAMVSRWRPEVQNDRLILLALVMPLPLLVTYADPAPVVAGLLWFACGVLQGFMLPLQATFNLSIEPSMRARVFGLGGSIAVGCSGVAYLAAGWVADLTAPATAVGLMALVSNVAIAVVFFRWPRQLLRSTVQSAYRTAP